MPQRLSLALTSRRISLRLATQRVKTPRTATARATTYASALLAATAWATLAFGTASAQDDTASGEPPRVVSSIRPLHLIALAVQEGAGTPEALFSSEVSPHGARLRPSEARRAASADILFVVGRALEGPRLLRHLRALAPEADWVVGLRGEGLELLNYPETRHGRNRHDNDRRGRDDDDNDDDRRGRDDHSDGEREHGRRDRHGDGNDNKRGDRTYGNDGDNDSDRRGRDRHNDERDDDDSDRRGDRTYGNDDGERDNGDRHGRDRLDNERDDGDRHGAGGAGGIDPHIWLSAHNAGALAHALAATLAEHDPSRAALYRANADAFAEEATATELRWEPRLAAVRERPFLTRHAGLRYFAARHGLADLGAATVSPERARGAHTAHALLRRLRNTPSFCFFTEPSLSHLGPTLANRLKGAKTAEVDILGRDAASWVALYDATATATATCLESPSQAP